MAEIGTARSLAKNILARLKRKRRAAGPCALASLHVGNDPATDVYVSSQMKTARELDIEYELYRFPRTVSARTLGRCLDELNASKKIKGIIVHHPLPKGIDCGKLYSRIFPVKDVEGVSPENLGRILIGAPRFIPPTVLSVLCFLEKSGIDLYGKETVIVGFSPHIGRPLCLILGNRFSTVTVTHIATYEKKRLPAHLARADIVVSCVGKPHLIKGAWIKKGAVVIDVGISRQRGSIVGDVEFDKAAEKASYITPVPGGVGALTTLFLFENLLKTGIVNDRK